MIDRTVHSCYDYLVDKDVVLEQKPSAAKEPNAEATPSAREDDPHVAEIVGYAMKPGVDDAQLLDAMADQALAQSRVAHGSEKWALRDKVDDLERAARSSLDAAEEAARTAKDKTANQEP